MTMVYLNLQPPDGTARLSPAVWWSLTPPSHPYLPKRGGPFLLPLPTVTNSLYFRKWSTLCCPDFPLASVSDASDEAGTLPSYSSAKLQKKTLRAKLFLIFYGCGAQIVHSVPTGPNIAPHSLNVVTPFWPNFISDFSACPNVFMLSRRVLEKNLSA